MRKRLKIVPLVTCHFAQDVKKYAIFVVFRNVTSVLIGLILKTFVHVMTMFVIIVLNIIRVLIVKKMLNTVMNVLKLAFFVMVKSVRETIDMMENGAQNVKDFAASHV